MVRIKINRSEVNRIFGPGGPAEEWIENKGNEIADIQRAEVPRDTGRLAESISVRVGHRRGTPYADVGPTAIDENGYPIALFIEFGTKPHWITPKKAKALWWPGATHPVKRVYHPGTLPYPFLRRSLELVRWS